MQSNPQTSNLSNKSVICPYLGKVDDQATPILFPSRFNRCSRIQKTRTPELGFQRMYCQSKLHEQCPLYIDESKKAEIPTIRSSGIPFGVNWLLAILLLLFLVCVISAVGILNKDESIKINFGRPASAPEQISYTVTPSTAAPIQTDVPIFEIAPPKIPTVYLFQTPTVKIVSPTYVPIARNELETPFGSAIKFVIHRVKAGESLKNYADLHFTTAALIKRVNYRLPNPIQVNSLIVIPENITEIDPNLPSFEIYRVMNPSIEIEELARRLGVDSQLLANYNGLKLDQILPYGYWLIIPR